MTPSDIASAATNAAINNVTATPSDVTNAAANDIANAHQVRVKCCPLRLEQGLEQGLGLGARNLLQMGAWHTELSIR